MDLEERLRAEDPPEFLEGIEIEMFMLTDPVRFCGPREHKPPLRFSFYGRDDQVELTYYRWVDDDGERYYMWAEFVRRAGL